MGRKGEQSIVFDKNVFLIGAASVVGPKEGEGPLKKCFDLIVEDPAIGEDTWEKGESALVRKSAEIAMRKAKLTAKDIRYAFAGDLLGQLIATTFGMKDMKIPLFGLFGACATLGEALGLAAMTVNAGYADNVLAAASSHFGSAEKQFRFPLEYGNQRPLSSTYTVTGCGSFIVSGRQGRIRITGITTGKIVDYGVTDSMNMGAAMAPAAADTINQNFEDFNRKPEDYDMIITGDLGKVGQKILFTLMEQLGYDLRNRYMDCGIAIYHDEIQDTHSGGSGCGCSAVTLAGYILPKVCKGEWKRILVVPTGALLSTVSFNEGCSIPGIAHGVVIEHVEL